ncbi:MAG: hypothetical protein KDE31_38515 [Caldilineaceae bacterium]|nr:hypothetical protein [Caldilineaceae bacterium]
MSIPIAIDTLLEQLQDNRTLVRAHAAKQVQQLQSPAPQVIAAVNEALKHERDSITIPKAPRGTISVTMTVRPPALPRRSFRSSFEH